MDTAVGLVRTYLAGNGYFTVGEFPIVEATEDGGFRSVTDIDVLAVRLPGAGRLVPRRPGEEGEEFLVFPPDPVLDPNDDRIDLIIGEVKEGAAELNHGARNPHVLRAAVRRCGGISARETEKVVDALIAHGEARAANKGPRVRLMAFGSYHGKSGGQYTTITLGHIVERLDKVARKHWAMLHTAQFKDPVVSMLMLLEKARRHHRRDEAGASR